MSEGCRRPIRAIGAMRRKGTWGERSPAPPSGLSAGTGWGNGQMPCWSLNDQHGIPVRTEPIAFVEGDLIGVHDMVEAAEGGNGHQHGGFRKMKV